MSFSVRRSQLLCCSHRSNSHSGTFELSLENLNPPIDNPVLSQAGRLPLRLARGRIEVYYQDARYILLSPHLTVIDAVVVPGKMK